ncbi:MAG: RES family NAD+ phosphorylase [Thermoanaerobaculia bacterium]
MSRRVWRMVKRMRAAGAFDGEGAQRTGGRWNSPGTPVVYTAEHISLAALELLVHLERAAVLDSYVVLPCDLPDSSVETLDRRLLPRHWRTSPAPAELQRLGDAWARARRSVALEVPSAVVELEHNVLLNPQHPDFAKVQFGDAFSFAFDPRLA